ncbi:MAG: hypothetical protein GY796_25560 [Chloroflexi bacterium]|nr:hypothetical protein [Chloroflexota bacterium]
MDRTVPSSGNEEINLYLRTYYSLLRSSSEVQVKSFVEAHLRMKSALHVQANMAEPDMAAFIYTVLRMPDCLDKLRLVVMGQSEPVFAQHGYGYVESWTAVTAPGRRRRSFFDGEETLAVYIASRSDIDDLIPILTAYQIERRKLQRQLNKPPVITLLQEIQTQSGRPVGTDLIKLAHATTVPAEDLEKLCQIWGRDTAEKLLRIAQEKQSLAVRLLSGSFIDYKRATRRWWQNVARHVPAIDFYEHPIYFVSSNTHSLANMLSGYALQIEDRLHQFIDADGSEELRREYHDIIEANVPSSLENFLYYALKKLEQTNSAVTAERLIMEREMGIVRIPSDHSFDIEVQIIPLNKLQMDKIDGRLCHNQPDLNHLKQSKALIVNIDYPLGMAAYQVLTEIARNVSELRGVYIMGKAATLNGRIGDVMIPSAIHDEQSLNTYLFRNCFSAEDVVPYLVYGNVMDYQKAITVPGTFLQNEGYMSIFYNEGYTDMEMEAGPYLSSVYEMVRPKRHPYNEIVNLTQIPFPIGMLHYASDTPFSKGKNLGTKNLSYFGMDPTYATMTAVLRHILFTESQSQ